MTDFLDNNTADDIEHAEHTKMNEIQSETKENKNVVNENADLSGENEMSHKIQAINKCEIAPLDLNRTTPSPTGQCNYSKKYSFKKAYLHLIYSRKRRKKL